METATNIRPFLVAGVVVGAAWLPLRAGQVALDHSLGQTGQALSGPDFKITSGNGRTLGQTLFFSFSEFNLTSGDTATFSGPSSIQNILTRVTGGQPTSIDGTIRSTIPQANFFLLNPKGIVFGPNAKLDVSGSFAASTADYLKLADGARFVAAVNADDSTLTSAAVTAFGFVGGSPGNIEVQQSTLTVPEGKTIALIGGNISVDGGSLQAPAGQIHVLSAQSAGEAGTDPTAGAGVNLGFPQQGAIQLQHGAQFDASGEGGGRIVIRGGSLTVDNSRIQANTTGATIGKGIDIEVVNDLAIANGGQINSLSPGGLATGGDIHLTAGSIHLDGGGAVDDNFNPTTQISTATGDPILGGGAAKGGDIVVQAARLELMNSAQISSATFGKGNAGRISIAAASVRLDALGTTPTQITANTQMISGGGNAGDIVIHADHLDMVNGATILAASFGSGKAGVIDINAQSIDLAKGAIITAGAFGSGAGGNIHVDADSVRIDGQDSLTGIQAVTTSTDTATPGGSIQIAAGSLDMRRMGSIFTTSYGLGRGGNIGIAAQDLKLANSSTVRASGEGMGPAGNISIQTEGATVLTGNSAISTSAPGSSGGDITVRAGSEIRLTDSQITGQAGLDGGNITVAAPILIYLLRSTLTAEADTAGGGFGNGGNLNINPSFLVLNQSALISKSSFGNGGNITIRSDYFFQSDSRIDASAPFGLPGTVVVTAPEVDLSGALLALAGNFLDAGMQLRPDCGVRLTGNISSFIVLGRGGMPIEPGGFAPSSVPAAAHERKK